MDSTLLNSSAGGPGDSRQRHVKYAMTLRRKYPDGKITIMLQAPASWSSKPIELDDGLLIYPVPSGRRLFLGNALAAVKRVIKRDSFDLVSTQTPFDDGLLGIWLMRRFGIPLNVQMRSSFLDLDCWMRERPFTYRTFNVVGKWVAGRAATIRVVSQGEKTRLSQIFPNFNGKLFALHPLVDAANFLAPIDEQKRDAVHAKLDAAGFSKRRLVLFVGRLAVQKNLPTLLHAFSRVKVKIQDAVLVIAGDGPMRRQLQELGVQLGIGADILWLGSMPLGSLRAWYERATCTALPSFHEGLPKVVIESFLMTTPAVASPFVSAPELVLDGETGFITKTFTNPAELADKMTDLLNTPDIAKSMGIKGRRHMMNYLLPEEVYLDRLVDIWRTTACAG
jgi:1,2-diacylglycerol 3-alpha-glucosyltransferase